MFQHIQRYPGDPILDLAEKFKQDTRTEKVNLSIGLYHDENGKVPELLSIRKAKEIYWNTQNAASLYLPMAGLASYCSHVQELQFGADAKALQKKRIATIQTLGGSGALSIGAFFLKRWFPDATLYVSDPTWENHIAIFENAGFSVKKYPYFNADTLEVDFEAMCAFLERLPHGSIVLLHPCCHNPTGCDLTETQWDRLVALLQKKQLIPFLDMAYQGLGRGFEKDAYAIRRLEAENMRFLLSYSFSKIFSLYGERVGALSVVCGDQREAETVLSQLKVTVRRIYSSPPAFGAHIVNIVLSDPELKNLWFSELEAMRTRIVSMRQMLAEELINAGAEPCDTAYLTRQNGMFSFANLTTGAVRHLREAYGIYIVGNGRICVAGLNSQNVGYVATALESLVGQESV
ncbi:MAG: amino acid aminotransferase [Chitinophagaceae bacterium]